jgi:hypothetical protein
MIILDGAMDRLLRRVHHTTQICSRERALFNRDLKHLLQDFENVEIGWKKYWQESSLLVAKNVKAKK